MHLERAVILALLLAGLIAGRAGAGEVNAPAESVRLQPFVQPDGFAGGSGTVPAALSLWPCFQPGRADGEQIFSFEFGKDIFVHINAPVPLASGKPLLLVLYALPNGNTLDQTFGKRLEPGDDWHYDIQHVGAQIRFLRSLDLPYTPVLVLLQTRQRSWPAWKTAHPADHGTLIVSLVNSLRQIFESRDPGIMLTGHSGGGRFIFSFLDQHAEIPVYVERIAFLDSNYGYESRCALPLARWLGGDPGRVLALFAYNDSLALLNGRRVVSDSGGTWHRGGRMLRDLARYYSFTAQRDTAFQRWTGLAGRIRFFLKENPHRGIWHTQQVARNGLIHAVLAGTEFENRGYRYWGEPAYQQWIGSGSQLLPALALPARAADALTGSQFIARVDSLSVEAREEAIWQELYSGNLPDFLRRPVLLEKKWADAAGDSHQVVFAALPDYLAIGSDADFVRMPMTPSTAQGAADLFGAILPTRKLVDALYQAAAVKLAPQPIPPVGSRNELPATFMQHQQDIESQWAAVEGRRGALTAGHKKDVVLSTRLAGWGRFGRVVIYGWHKPDGQPIQPLTDVHISRYVDYSHGVRLLVNMILIDGVPRRVEEILGDPLLHPLISDEEGVITQTRYNTASESGIDR